MAYKVNDLANYIVEFSKGINNPVNNLQLQKILYYLQARYLVEKGQPLFEERIEKWQYGPVIPEVYHRFKHLGAKDIIEIPVEFDFFLLLDEDFEIDDIEDNIDDSENIDDNDKIVIDDTIRKLGKYQPFDLVDETHKHQSWLDCQDDIYGGTRNLQYEDVDILRDFQENPEFQLWAQ